MTTITPPFTGSYAVGLQGINVSRFDLFGVSIAPKLGRSGASTFISGSGGVVDVSPDTRSFFDDSLRLPKPITSVGTVGSVEVISDDTFRVMARPNFRLSDPTYGLEPVVDEKNYFEEMNELDAVTYIKDPNAVQYPVVYGVEGPIDPYSFAGAIEPFPIRKVIAGTSTFVGDHDDPEPQGVRGSLSSGMIQYSSRNKSRNCDNFYLVDAAEKFSAYVEISFDEFQELSTPAMPIKADVVSDSGETSTAFTDKEAISDAYKKVSNKQIRDVLTSAATRIITEIGYPTAESKSLACGFEYQNSRGIDSIAYGGLLK